MKLHSKIENVFKIVSTRNKVIVGISNNQAGNSILTGGDELIILHKGVKQKSLKSQLYTFFPFDKGILFSEKNGSDIKYWNNENILTIVESNDEKVFLDSLQIRTIDEPFVYRRKKDGNKQNYILLSDLSSLKIPTSFSLLLAPYYIKVEHPNTIKAFVINDDVVKLKWEVDITKYGELDDRNNFMWDTDKLYVPLKKSTLLALNIESGNKIWYSKIDSNEFTHFNIQNQFIYQSFGKGLNCIKSSNGELIKTHYFNKQDFQASGPLWCFDDILVLINSVYGKIVVFDYSFEIAGFYDIGSHGIANSEKKIVYQDSFLYVLGMDNILYIFDLNEVKI